MKRTDAFKSNYLGQGDLEQPTIAVIQDVGIESLNGDGGKEDKPVAHFTNGIKPMILNLINWQTIEDAYGEDSDLWVGKRVELYVDKNVMFGAKKVGGVRVRIPNGVAHPAVDKSPVDALKRTAWNTFKAKYPDATPDDLAALWRKAIDKCFHKEGPKLTAAEWAAFVKNGFEPGSPISEEEIFTEEEVPF